MESDLSALYALIKRFEGCKLTPYLCPAGVWTCGWGSTGPDVFPGRVWTQEYADKRLEMDAIKFARGVVMACPDVSGSRLCALADFAYNMGLGAFRGSTLRRKVNDEDWHGAREQIMRWNKAGGRVLNGLTLRRSAEARLLV